MSEPNENENVCNICFEVQSECICPECPMCAEFAQQACYVNHGLRLSKQQLINRTDHELVELQETLNEITTRKYWLKEQPDTYCEEWSGRSKVSDKL